MKLSNHFGSAFRTLAVILAACLFSGCDKDDDSVYPNVLTDFMDLYTNGESTVDRIHPDASSSPLTLLNRLSGEGLQPDTTYRAVGMYRLPDEKGETAVYSVTLIYAEPPFKPHEGMKVVTDPLYLESVSRGGNYLNIVVQPMMQTKPHSYAFVEDSVVNINGHKMLYLTLAHNQNGDRESFPRRVYLSAPLKSYGFTDGDSISLRVNVYDKGVKEWRVAY